MTRVKESSIGCLLVLAVLLTMPLVALAQEAPSHIAIRPLAENVIIPQAHIIAPPPDRRNPIEIKKIKALIDIKDSTATTTIEIHLRNTTAAPWGCSGSFSLRTIG